MARANYCEFFRFDDQFCDVFIENSHYLYAECEPFGWAHMLTCKEFYPRNDGGFTVSAYCGADAAYLHDLEPARESVALEIIASEYVYTLECEAKAHGYTAQAARDEYRANIASGCSARDAYLYALALIVDGDL